VHSKTVRTVLNATLGGLPWQSKPSSDIEQTVVTEGGFHFSAVFEFNVQSDEMLQVLESWCGDLDSSLGMVDGIGDWRGNCNTRSMLIYQ
jgi:hypothetical protein